MNTHQQIPLVSLNDLTLDQLRSRLVADNIRPQHAETLWRALYRNDLTDPRQHLDLPPPLQRWLSAHLESEVRLDHLKPIDSTRSNDNVTRKFLFHLDDGKEIETVIMGYPGRFTACLSTQAGCAMGCVFCATGQMGFQRHLRPGEIAAQVSFVQRELREHGQTGPRNVVLMGMGEPLHNYDAVMTALAIIREPTGLNIGPGRITVSTVGVVPGILRMADEQQPYNLAVSLHATRDEPRSALIPVNARWPIRSLVDACRTYCERTGRRIFFGWTLIDGTNDSPEEAHRLAELLEGMDAHVNLIRLNPTRGYDGHASAPSAAQIFHRIIQHSGLPCTIRQRRGIDVAAGCGQLRAQQEYHATSSPSSLPDPSGPTARPIDRR